MESEEEAQVYSANGLSLSLSTIEILFFPGKLSHRVCPKRMFFSSADDVCLMEICAKFFFA